MVIPSEEPPQDPLQEWVRRHCQLVGAALLLPVWVTVSVLIFFLVPPASRDLAMRAGMAVSTVLLSTFYAWVWSPLPPVGPKPAGVPALSIREHFGRTWAYYVRITIPVMVSWLMAVMLFLPLLPKVEEYALAGAGAVAIQMLGYRLARKQLRCPRCGSNFKKERHARLGRWSRDSRMPWELWDACPHCSVSFDDPWP